MKLLRFTSTGEPQPTHCDIRRGPANLSIAPNYPFRMAPSSPLPLLPLALPRAPSLAKKTSLRQKLTSPKEGFTNCGGQSRTSAA
ncbi:MAG: hypothetical protein ACTS44_01130 [Candidatus Hodgkinia cicadicola]